MNGQKYPSPPPFSVPFDQLVEIVGALRPVPQTTWCRFVINRGTNTGSGPTYIYWISYGTTDVTGAAYLDPNPHGVPFSQLTDVVSGFFGRKS